MLLILSDFFILTLSGLIFGGIFLYIHGIVNDLKRGIDVVFQIESKPPSDPERVEIWWIYVSEIDLHGEIIRYYTG